MSTPIYALTESGAFGPDFTIQLPEAAHPIFIGADWYGPEGGKQKMQLVVTATDSDEPVAVLRFNDDGTLHSISVSGENAAKVVNDDRKNDLTDAWLLERMGE